MSLALSNNPNNFSESTISSQNQFVCKNCRKPGSRGRAESSKKLGSKGRTEKGRTENCRKVDLRGRTDICRKLCSKGRIEEGMTEKARMEKCWKGKGRIAKRIV